MSTISSIQQAINRYNFSMEKPTQSINKKVLIEQLEHGLKISVKDGKGKVYPVEKWMIEGLPKIDKVPKEFFDLCYSNISGSLSEIRVHFKLPLKGGFMRRGQQGSGFNPKPMCDTKTSGSVSIGRDGFKVEGSREKKDCGDPGCRTSGKYDGRHEKKKT